MTVVLLDTNAYRLMLAGDSVIGDFVKKAKTIYISLIVLGELYSSFKGGTREKENLEILADFLEQSSVKIAILTNDTSKLYGNILASLYKLGRPIPTNDIWIAATAKELGATIITYDRHFLNIPGVKVWNKIKDY